MLIRQIVITAGAVYSRNRHIPFAPFPGLNIAGLEVLAVGVCRPGMKQDEIEVVMKAPEKGEPALIADGFKKFLVKKTPTPPADVVSPGQPDKGIANE